MEMITTAYVRVVEPGERTVDIKFTDLHWAREAARLLTAQPNVQCAFVVTETKPEYRP